MPRGPALPSQRIVPVGVALLVLLAGCGGVLDQRPPSDERAVEVRSDLLDAVSEVDTYRFAADFHAEGTEGDDRRTVRVASNGSVSVADRRLHATSRYEEQEKETYVVGDRIYTECASPWSGWGLRNVSEEADDGGRWLNATPLGRQAAILERSRVYWVGTETVDGRETAVIEARPTNRELRGLSDGFNSGDLTQRAVKNVTLRVWVDVESDLPVKSVLSIELRRGGVSVSGTATTTFSDYGEPVSITVPDEVTEDPWRSGCPGQD